ncbi:MAG: hypothetical protein PHT19_01030 [Methylococcus sp.]|nr:hypothetical protein [Methylococcus sp.]
MYESALGILASLACVALWIAELPLWAKLVLSFLLAVYGLFLRGGGRLAARLEAAGAWRVILPGDRSLAAELLESSFVSPVCVVLHFATEQGRIALPVFKDSVDAETYRSLCVHLACSRTGYPRPLPTEPR